MIKLKSVLQELGYGSISAVVWKKIKDLNLNPYRPDGGHPKSPWCLSEEEAKVVRESIPKCKSANWKKLPKAEKIKIKRIPSSIVPASLLDEGETPADIVTKFTSLITRLKGNNSEVEALKAKLTMKDAKILDLSQNLEDLRKVFKEQTTELSELRNQFGQMKQMIKTLEEM